MEKARPKLSNTYNNIELNQNIVNEQNSVERSQWMPQFLEDNPQILSFRERILPFTGGFSFSNIINAAKTASLTPINRFILLQLIYNHLYSIGMFQTAEMMKQETGLNFQIIHQSCFRTHLTILISLGVIPNENPWNVKKDPLTVYVEEKFDEDYLSSSYREDPSLITQELNDQNLNTNYNGRQHDYQHLISCSLRRLVILLVLDQCDKFQYQYEIQQSKSIFKIKPKMKKFFITDNELHGLFLTLHSITSSNHFLDQLINIFHVTFPSKSPFKDKQFQTRAKISVLELIQKWVLFRGFFIGKLTIHRIKEFIEKVLKSDIELAFNSNPEPVDYRSFLIEFNDKINHLKSGIFDNDILSNKHFEQPAIRDTQLMFKPNLKFIHPDSLETARQLTLISHSLYQKVHSRELMNALINKKIDKVFCPYLADLIQFSNGFSQIVIETIIESDHDRNEVFTKVLEIAYNLDSLFNYQVLSDLTQCLARPEILSIVQATQGQIGELRELQNKCGDGENFFIEYTKSVQKRSSQMKPAIPNFNAEIKEANYSPSPDFLNGLINVEKRRVIAEKLTLFYSFQNIEYNFLPVQQIQKTLLVSPSLSKENLEKNIEKVWLTVNDFNI